MRSGYIKPKRYIVWSTDKEINLDDPFQRKWYIQQVLTYGRTEDIMELDWEEVEKLLPELRLPETIKALWEEYFASKGQRDHN
jgi:hypothetical protein